MRPFNGALLSLGVALAAALGAGDAQANPFATDDGWNREPQSDSLVIRKIFVFPGSDDVGNVIAPELDEALAKRLEKNSRFQVVRNPKISDALRRDEKGYNRIVVSPEVHARAARLAGADTTVVLESRHIGQELKIKEDWRRADGSLLFSETQSAVAKSPIGDQKKIVERITDAVVARIPFQGTVTGRTGNTITVDLNEDQVSPGDKLTVARVVSTKEHPLLKTLVNIDFVTVGTAQVTSADNVLAFAKIIGEPTSEQIGVEHKIVNIERYVGGSGPQGYGKSDVDGAAGKKGGDKWGGLAEKEKALADPLDVQESLGGEYEKTKARFGTVGARILTGNISHDESNAGINTELSSFAFGAGVMGEAWITKEWILGLGYEFMSATLKGNRAGTPLTASGTSWSRFDIYGGYRYLPEDSIDGTIVTFGLGYESLKMNLPLDTANQIGKKSYSGLLLLVSGDIAIDPSNRVEAIIALQPFSSLGETEFISGSPDGANVVNAGAKWKYLWKTNLFLMVGLDYNVANGTITGGKSMTEKRFAISPGLKYLF